MNKIKQITKYFSQPYEIQKGLFPEFVNVADQLAVEWEIALNEIEDSQLTDEQKQAVQALDDYMLSISGPTNLVYWNDNALQHSDEWNEMRRLAKIILNTMGWEDECTYETGVIYIGNQNQ
ncbi:hypothetical protein [Serratia microhaemolytica]|uniref:hypothetical protein n=1 Tax=Serratia microhaemolytica TaxID=2675110 RepID=UPI000FDF1573|nr:hypothetical protein [Serratia microhaemolytica]